MPLKITTETDLRRLFPTLPCSWKYHLWSWKAIHRKYAGRTPYESILSWLWRMRDEKYDGMIITRESAEQMPYEGCGIIGMRLLLFWLSVLVMLPQLFIFVGPAQTGFIISMGSQISWNKNVCIFRHHINVQGLSIFRGFDDEVYHIAVIPNTLEDIRK